MLYNFEYFYNVMKKSSKDKINCAVFGMWRGRPFIELFSTFIIASFFFYALFDYHVLRYIVMYLVYGIYILIASSRKIGLSHSENGYTYVKFKSIIPKAKEVDNILTENIKYLVVKRFLGRNYVTMSYINDIGKLKKIRIVFSSFIIGFSIKAQKVNSDKILKELIELQKVLDRGDF